MKTPTLEKKLTDEEANLIWDEYKYRHDPGRVCLDDSHQSAIDVSGLPSGSYFLHAVGKGEQWVRKFEVAH